MSSKAAPTFYVLHGDDFLVEGHLAKLRAQMAEADPSALNYVELPVTASVPELVSAVSAVPFLSDRRMVVVRGLLNWLTRANAGQAAQKTQDNLLAALPTLPDSARLTFVEREPVRGNSKLLRGMEGLPRGFVRLFEPPKNLSSWLVKRAQEEYDAAIEPAAANALAESVEGDLRRADNELFKLIAYAGDRPVGVADVALLTSRTAETNVFQLATHLAAGRGQAAMTLLHQVLSDPKEDPFKLWGLVVRQFRLMLLAKEHLASGGGSGNLADALKLNPYAARDLPGLVRDFTIVQLEAVYRRLLDYDTRIKTGRLAVPLALELLVVSLAQGK